jgi:hypothetical protein
MQQERSATAVLSRYLRGITAAVEMRQLGLQTATPMMVHLNTMRPTRRHAAFAAKGLRRHTAMTNNERLRQLITEAGLTQAVALTIFNRGLGPAAYSESTWKAFLADPETTRFRPLKDELLAHAEVQFAKLKQSRR